MRQVTSDKEYISNSAEETKKIAAIISSQLKDGEVLALSGDLGSGKTTFVQGLAEALGIKERINSPTFVMVKQYKINLKSQISKSLPAGRQVKTTTKNLKPNYLYHMDMYRVKSVGDAISAGIMDYLGRTDTICVIEWAERAQELLPKKTIWVGFEHLGEDKRKIKFLIPEFLISNEYPIKK